MGLYYNYKIFYGHLIWAERCPPPDTTLPEDIRIIHLESGYYAICVAASFKDMGASRPDSTSMSTSTSTSTSYDRYDKDLDACIARLSIQKRRPGAPGHIVFESCCCTMTDPSSVSYNYTDMRET